MATTTPTGRFFPVPDLVGVKAPEAITRLRELGLTPVTLPSAVADVAEAGFVLGIDPPPDSPVRTRAKITLSVGTHPDSDSRSETLSTEPSTPVQPPLAWPHSADAGLAAPDARFAPASIARAPQSAAKPGVASAPASSSDAASGEFPQDAGSSRADTATFGAAAESYFDDLSEDVPTPADYADLQDEWDRLRASESARFADDYAPAPGDAGAPTQEPPVVTAEIVDLQAERDAEERARREKRRRSARRYRRMSLKQRFVVGGLFGLIVLLIIAAATNKTKLKPNSDRSSVTATKPTPATHKAPARHHTPIKHEPKPAHPRLPRPKAHTAPAKRRVIVIHRTRTKVVTVTVTTPTSTPTTVGSSYTPPPTSTSTYTHSSSSAATPVYHAPATTSPKPASTHASADKTSSGTGGGSTLQTPNGAIAPPTPNQP